MPFPIVRLILIALLSVVVLLSQVPAKPSNVALVTSKASSTETSGAEIYSHQCARCHGSEGQGVEEFYAEPLVGDLSVSQLSKLISETMPEGSPDQCVAEDARKVAQFIHERFYRRSSSGVKNAPRRELQRRTVRQYREAISDLIASFSDPLWIPEERGLTANYFAASRWQEKRRLSKQIDPKIDFPAESGGVPHFRPDGSYEGVEEVKKANKMGDGFAVFWSGGIIAPESGRYEFVVHSRNGFRLWVNDPRNPLIDQWVRSDEQREHRKHVHLIGGRFYFFKLDLFSFEDPEVDIQVQWKRPGRELRTIPSDYFVRYGSREIPVVTTAFPPDDASFGFERGTAVSRQWDEATTSAAIETAQWVSERIWRLSGTKPTAEDRKIKARNYCVSFVERAFVSPLSKDEVQFFVDQHFEQELSLADQVKRVVILALKSPRFLYPNVQRRDRHHELAQRLALFFWDSLPDRPLHKLANKKQLINAKRRTEQSYAMLHSSRSRQKLKAFFNSWLRLDVHDEVSKDAERFPGYDPRLVQSLRDSLELFLDEVAWSEASDYRQFFLSPEIYFNQAILDFYGSDELVNDAPTNDAFIKVDVGSQRRAGILTHPFLMAGLAYHKDSSPIHRGVFVARSLMGRQLRQPPDEVEPLSEDFDRTLTTRQRVEIQTKEAACIKCHQVINPLGFSLENFDAVGRFRDREKEKPINTVSTYETSDGKQIRFRGPQDLAEFLANNELAQRHFLRQLFNYYTKQPVEAFGEDTLDRLHQSFVDSNYNIQAILIEMANVFTHEWTREETQDVAN